MPEVTDEELEAVQAAIDACLDSSMRVRTSLAQVAIRAYLTQTDEGRALVRDAGRWRMLTQSAAFVFLDVGSVEQFTATIDAAIARQEGEG